MTTSNENPLDSQAKFVYESPDGGRTVYRRQLGTIERTITEESVHRWNIFAEEMKEDILWTEIRAAADKDPVMAEMLIKIKTYYYLKHQS